MGQGPAPLQLQRQYPTAELESQKLDGMTKDQSTPAMKDAAGNADGSDQGQHATLDRVMTRAHELKDKQRSNMRQRLRTAVRLNCYGIWGA